MNNPIQWVGDDLARYLLSYPEETNQFAVLRQQLAEQQDIQDRKNMLGHVTSSMFVLSSNMTQVLLIHHKAFDTWLCPGGHYEGHVSPYISALRELTEETGMDQDMVGLRGSLGDFILLDIDTHPIPVRPSKGEGEHVHHDFLYLARATAPFTPVPQLEEVFACGWFPVEGLKDAEDSRLRRVSAKVITLLNEMNG